MTEPSPIHAEKLAQAQGMLSPGEVWLIAARESLERPEPGLALVAAVEVTWDSFFLVTNSEAVALVGRYDADAMPAGWRTLPYDEDPGEVLRAELERMAPGRILLDYAPDDPLSDGLTHGLYLRLVELLPGRPFESASAFLGKLRSGKTAAEREAVRVAVDRAEADLGALAATIRPGWSERDCAAFLHDRLRADGLEPAWGWAGCPTVHAGPEGRPSHAGPTDRRLEPGMLLHIDYGVRQGGYCSDIQRTFYLPRPGEGVPAAVEAAFRACWAAIEAAARALRPGVRGFEVDAAARSSLKAAGYPEYKHAVGHGLGRATHDGGTLLGPRWPRYGSTPEGVIAAGEVYTLELGAFVSGYGFVGLEEDVAVLEAGLEWLSQRQEAMLVLTG